MIMFKKYKFFPDINQLTDLVNQHESAKLEVDCRNEEVTVMQAFKPGRLTLKYPKKETKPFTNC